MRTLLLSTLALATLATPIAAAAQRGELQEDRREIRREYRDLQDARRDGDRGDIREERRELRDARREYRQDLNDRRGYGYDTNRRDNRDYRNDGRRDDRRGYYYDERRGYGYNNEAREFRRYQGANYYYPRGFAYRAWNTGAYLPRAYWNDRYYIGRPAAFGLPLAYRGTRWVRVGPDALLIRARNGVIVRVVRNLYY